MQAGLPLTEKVRGGEIAGSAALLVSSLAGRTPLDTSSRRSAPPSNAVGTWYALVEHEVPHASLAIIEGIEHIRFDSANLAALGADLTVALLQVENPQQPVHPPAMVVNAPRQALAVQFQAELSLTAGQVFLGVFMVLLVVGCVTSLRARPPRLRPPTLNRRRPSCR